jgi:FtsH-binding integral membrane protein
MKNAKAYAALVGSVATALLGVYAADTPVGKVLTVLAVVATAFGTWAVENAE